MWKDLRSRLERWGWLPPRHDRLTLTGQVRSPEPEADGTDDHRSVLLSVTIAGGKASLHRLDPDSRFRIELAFDRVVRLTIVRQGHLPRMVEVQPLRSNLRFARSPVHARCEIDVTLTPRQDQGGAAGRPMMERITMPKDHRPLTVEWDHVVRAEQSEEFVPLFLRAV